MIFTQKSIFAYILHRSLNLYCCSKCPTSEQYCDITFSAVLNWGFNLRINHFCTHSGLNCLFITSIRLPILQLLTKITWWANFENRLVLLGRKNNLLGGQMLTDVNLLFRSLVLNCTRRSVCYLSQVSPMTPMRDCKFSIPRDERGTRGNLSRKQVFNNAIH